MSTGAYAGSDFGLPVRRSKSDPWRGHSTVQDAWSNSPSASGPVVVGATVLDREELAAHAMKDADLPAGVVLDETHLAFGQLIDVANS